MMNMIDKQSFLFFAFLFLLFIITSVWSLRKSTTCFNEPISFFFEEFSNFSKELLDYIIIFYCVFYLSELKMLTVASSYKYEHVNNKYNFFLLLWQKF